MKAVRPGAGCCCCVSVAAMATAAALGTLEKGAGPVVRRGVLCHFLLEARLDSNTSVESSRKARRYDRYWCFRICGQNKERRARQDHEGTVGLKSGG